MKTKQGLGRGLGALIGSVQSTERGIEMIDVRKIEPNPSQPRVHFDEESLAELARSIEEFGVIQPLIVKQQGDHFTIIAGERRYRAARMAKLTSVPVIVKEYTEVEILQVALIENLQRKDLTPLEEAMCYKRLVDDFLFSTDEIARKLGRTKHSITLMLGLLDLGQIAQGLVASEKLLPSHAKVLLGIEDASLQAECAEEIFERGLTVREAEAMVAARLRKKPSTADDVDDASVRTSNAYALAYKETETELTKQLGSPVRIKPGTRKSKIEIEYFSLDDLERLLVLFRSLR